MFSKFFAGYRLVFTFALVKPEVKVAPPVAVEGIVHNGPMATIKRLLADTRFTWRKITTLAAKAGTTESAARAVVIELGGKISRNGRLAKAGTTAPPVAPAPWDRAETSNDDDDAEDDDFIESEENEEDEYNDEDEDSDDEDGSDLDDESEYDESKVTILTDLLEAGKFKWRKLPTLAQAAGLPESEARDYLEHIGATESRRGGLFRI